MGIQHVLTPNGSVEAQGHSRVFDARECVAFYLELKPGFLSPEALGLSLPFACWPLWLAAGAGDLSSGLFLSVSVWLSWVMIVPFQGGAWTSRSTMMWGLFSFFQYSTEKIFGFSNKKDKEFPFWRIVGLQRVSSHF